MASERRCRELAPIRPGCAEDIPALHAILRESPETVDWLPEIGTASAAAGTLLLVSESLGEIVGFVVGRQVVDEGEVLNIAIRRGGRRSGVGSALLGAILAIFREQKAARVFLEVRESNAAALAFYQVNGFRRVGSRPGYYHHPDEAALMLELKLAG
jgi:ribosomal-protein-alanine N-acetyltransferase